MRPCVNACTLLVVAALMGTTFLPLRDSPALLFNVPTAWVVRNKRQPCQRLHGAQHDILHPGSHEKLMERLCINCGTLALSGRL